MVVALAHKDVYEVSDHTHEIVKVRVNLLRVVNYLVSVHIHASVFLSLINRCCGPEEAGQWTLCPAKC